MKTGIAIAGSILVDKINEISAYPQAGELTKIKSVQKAVGGCVPNVAIDLKRICPQLTVKAVGKIGKDEEGEYVTSVLSENGVETADITVGDEKTSFTEVMSQTGGQRTFFTYAGASADFGVSDVDLENLDVKMVHLGYFLLLDKIDNGDGEAFLKKAKACGIKTSIDLVSENSDRYSIVLPCLPYVDNLIINETEAGKLVGMEPTKENLEEIARKLKAYGVKERVIIHMPELGICVSESGVEIVYSYALPKGFIQGTTGAGDAFCAGALYGIHEGKSDREILEFSSAAAVAALSKPDATSGLKSEKEILAAVQGFARQG
ncbi:MAG: carbohydrate kinase family protein [Clostridia bacterium]|nr:carbohydrate kinase family protein [Clostridia bacterium]MBO7170437.1 carbohydrate kinase family protein [Clostridia bacterium]